MSNTPLSLSDLEVQYLQVSTLATLNTQQVKTGTLLAPALKREVDRLAKLIADLKTPADDFGKRFGPTWQELNPNGVDTRPTLFSTPDKPATLLNADGTKMTFQRCDPYNVGAENGDLSDYWSDSGQAIYKPDPGAVVTYRKVWDKPEMMTTPNPGIDRVETFGHYDGVFATSPRLDYASGTCRPEDFRAHEPRYANADQPIGMVRNDGSLTNEALVITANGTLMAAGTQTSRGSADWPLPVLVLPAGKKPTGGIAITTGNELCLITVIDTVTGKGQLAVVALEGKFISYHVWPYMGLANQGSWSDFKLLGFVDLSIAAPDHVSAASNGFWESPGQTAGKPLAQLLLSDPLNRKAFLTGEYGWTKTVATKGYAIVSGKSDDKAVIVDLSPVFGYLSQSWLSDYDATAASRGALPNQFPQAFDLLPTNKPREVYSIAASKPSCVLAGKRIERWSADFHKAYVATEAGLVLIVDTSSLMARYDFEKSNALGVIGSFTVGRNPVDLCFARFEEDGLPLIPVGRPVDKVNNLFWAVCRGERRIDYVVTFGGQGLVVRSVQDARVDDPVGCGVGTRANILSVADYTGKKVHSFRIGNLTAKNGKVYGAGKDGKEWIEYSGSLAFPGGPFAINSANVN
jgi:hypothetical protein